MARAASRKAASPSPAKSADAFRTISEVANTLGIQKHVLRFWEGKFPQIKPMKRGGGRRYYRPDDMELLMGIRHLLHDEGLTIKGVQKIFKEQGVEFVKGVAREADGAIAMTRAAGASSASAATARRSSAASRSTTSSAPMLHDAVEFARSELATCIRILEGDVAPNERHGEAARSDVA